MASTPLAHTTGRCLLLFRFLTIAGVALLGAACSSSQVTESVRPPATVKLKVGGGAAIEGTPWTVIFDSVISDSRCPIDAICIQAGEALLALELASPLADPLPQDSPHFTLGTTPVVVEGLRFTQVKVLPFPQSNVQIDRASYQVTLLIEAVGG
jgi:hypothetical protein